MGALKPDLVGHARHVAFFTPDVMQEILVLETFARFAKRQIERNARVRTVVVGMVEPELA